MKNKYTAYCLASNDLACVPDFTTTDKEFVFTLTSSKTFSTTLLKDSITGALTINYWVDTDATADAG